MYDPVDKMGRSGQRIRVRRVGMSQDNKKEIHLQPDLPEQGVGFAHRRQVIRGLASIPVALTLSNGAAAANASSHICLMQEYEQPYSKNDESEIMEWAHHSNKIAPAGWGDRSKKYCVAYADEDPQGSMYITGYHYKTSYTSKFINENGYMVNGGVPKGHALRASCATSFMVSGGGGGGGGGWGW